MVPHLRWQGCNNHAVSHLLAFCCPSDYPQIAQFDIVRDTTVAITLKDLHEEYLQDLWSVGEREVNYRYFYKFLHITCGERHSCMRTTHQITVLNSPLLALEDTMIPMVDMFVRKYKTRRICGEL
jgi:hypothetical protein